MPKPKPPRKKRHIPTIRERVRYFVRHCQREKLQMYIKLTPFAEENRADFEQILREEVDKAAEASEECRRYWLESTCACGDTHIGEPDPNSLVEYQGVFLRHHEVLALAQREKEMVTDGGS